MVIKLIFLLINKNKEDLNVKQRNQFFSITKPKSRFYYSLPYSYRHSPFPNTNIKQKMA